MTFIKRCLIAAVALLVVAAETSAAERTDSVVLSLDSCLAIALDDSRTVRVADLDIRRVDYSRREVLGQILPSVSFGGTYSRMLAKQVAYMNMDGFDGMGGGNDSDNESGETVAAARSQKKDTGIKMGLDNSFQVGFSASMPLIAPQLWQSLKLSDSQIAVSVEQARASRLDLVNKVKTAYYAFLLAKDSRRVIRQSYDMAALTNKIYKDRLALGDASEYDVLRTEVSMKNVEPELTQADIAIKQARLQLLILMGLPVDAPVDFAGELSQYDDPTGEFATLPKTDFSRNTSLVQSNLQLSLLGRSVKMQKASFLPTLALSASYNWTSSSNGSPFRTFRWNPYSVIGLTLSLPLYEGGQRYYRVRQAQVQEEQARLQREDLENSIAMQVNLANDNIRLNARQIYSTGQSVRQADKAYDIMRQSFDIGAASYLDLRDAELALTRSRLAYLQSIYNYMVANADLDLLVGDDSDIQSTSRKSSVK